MKKILFISLIHSLSISVAQTDAEKAARIDSIFQVYANKNMLSGSVLIAKKGKVLLSKGYGMANYSYDIPNSSSTKYILASVTKPFIAMAIMILMEKGKLSTEDKLNKYISDYPNGDKITIHHLLTHTSGIPDHNHLPGFVDSFVRMPHTIEQMIELTKYKPLEFEPGSKYQYSNPNYILLTYILEKVSSKNYGDYIKEFIFDPLGMRNSGLFTNKQVVKNIAVGYTEGANGLEHARYIDMSIATGAGELYSTVDDLLLWDQSFYTEKLVKKATLEKMLKPYIDKSGYGWGIDKYASHKLIVKGGATFGFNAIISRFPDDELCIIFITNVDNYNVFRGPGLARAIMFDQPYTLPEERKIVNVDKKIYQKLVGEYEFEPRFYISITTDGNRIFSNYTGEDKSEILPTSDYNYYIKLANTEIQFIKDTSENIICLKLLGAGAEKLCKKVK